MFTPMLCGFSNKFVQLGVAIVESGTEKAMEGMCDKPANSSSPVLKKVGSL